MIGKLTTAAQKLQMRNAALEKELLEEKARRCQASDELAALKAKLEAEERERDGITSKLVRLQAELAVEVRGCLAHQVAFAFAFATSKEWEKLLRAWGAYRGSSFDLSQLHFWRNLCAPVCALCAIFVRLVLDVF